MKTVIVTGAAGFLGSHLCEHYLKKNYTVIGIDNFSTGQRQNIEFLKSLTKDFTFFEYDACRPWKNLEANFSEGSLKNLKYIFHLASPASPPHYQRLALETIWVNTLGLNEALVFADQFKAKVIFSSTSEVYGDPAITPQPETYFGHVNSFGERSCYDEAKRCGEALIFSHNKKFKTEHGLVRIFNTYGPRMNPNDGRVVINFILQALKNQDLTVYGDGKQTRSFCYVDDLILGLTDYAEQNLNSPINIGNDKEFTMLELAQTVLKITQSQSQIKFFPLPSDDPKKRRPDLTLAFKKLPHFKPQVSLEEGLKKMAHWIQDSK